MIGLQYTVIAGGIFMLITCWEDVERAKRLMGNGIYSPREYPKKYTIPSKRIRKIYRIRKYKIPKFALLYLYCPFLRIGIYIGELMFVIIFHEEVELCRGLNYLVAALNSVIWLISGIFLVAKEMSSEIEKKREKKKESKSEVPETQTSRSEQGDR